MSNSKNKTLQNAVVIYKWPDAFDCLRGDLIPKELLGATIIAIGTADFGEHRPEGGGLIIDYIPVATTEHRRIVIAFTELGMWVDYLSCHSG